MYVTGSEPIRRTFSHNDQELGAIYNVDVYNEKTDSYDLVAKVAMGKTGYEATEGKLSKSQLNNLNEDNNDERNRTDTDRSGK